MAKKYHISNEHKLDNYRVRKISQVDGQKSMVDRIGGTDKFLSWSDTATE